MSVRVGKTSEIKENFELAHDLPRNLLENNIRAFPSSPPIRKVRRIVKPKKILSASRALFKENEASSVKKYHKSRTTNQFNILTESKHFFQSNEPEQLKSSFCKTSASLSFISQASKNDESSGLLNTSSISQDNKFKSPIRSSISQYCQVNSLSFEEAVTRFNKIPQTVIKKKLWKLSFFKKIGICWGKHRLEDENLETAEKIIKFALTEYSEKNSFHLSLIKSVQNILEKEYTLIKPDKVHSMISTNKYPMIGLLNFMFLTKYFTTQVSLLFEYCKDPEKVIRIVFGLSDTSVETLRKAKLNKYISQCNKCLEVFCFFYAGLIVHWNCNFGPGAFSFKTKYLKKILKGNIYSIIKSAELLYE